MMINPMTMIPAPYRLAVLLLAWGASLVAVGWWQRHDGIAVTEAAWQTREAAQQAAAARAIQTLHQAARQTEQRHAHALAEISTHYQEAIKDANTSRNRDIADLRAGTLRLRDPYALTLSTCASIPGETAPAPGGRDGHPGAGLSGEAAEFLYRLAGEADDIARQLTACQAVIRSDRVEARE